MKISVVIPTHNPRRDILRRTVAALAAQTFPAADWELVVVDNASQPAVIPEELGPMPALVPVRIVREERLGTAHARFTAIAAARHEIIASVDDDNVLDPGYLAAAAAFLASHPEVGAVGGRIEPEYEAPAPPWALAQAGLLALRDLGPEPVISVWRPGSPDFPWCSPYGAGVVAHAACLRRYRDHALGGAAFDGGRVGLQSLGGCEDAEMMLKGVLEAGLQVAYSPALRLLHLIPARRLQFTYLYRLARESGVAWARFCVRNGFAKPIPRWTVPLRQARAFFRFRAWTKIGRLAWAVEAGRFAGRAAAS